MAFKKYNLFALVILAFVLWRQAPLLINSFKLQGTKLESKEYVIIGNSTIVLRTEFPQKNKRAIVIFWATWCGPCITEMGRLKSSVINGKIPVDAIYAINPFESNEIILTFLSKNLLPFTFIAAPDVAQLLNIQSTPTTIFIEDNLITSMSSGMSLVGIWRAEWFL